MLPNPLFYVFGNGVNLYGISIAVGILVCIIVLFLYLTKKQVPQKLQDFIFFVGVIAIAIGFLFAKLYQAVYTWIDTGVFDFYSAGMTVMGGLIGGAVSFLLCYFIGGIFVFKGKEDKLHIKYFGDLLSVAPCCIAVAHAFGRIGCLMSGCCHGTYLGQSYVFGGIWMKGVANGWGYYIPTQLYESLFLFALFAVLSICYFKRVNIVLSIYLIAYGIWRMFIEFFRGDYLGEIIPNTITPSQWQSIIFILIGVAIIVFYLIRRIPLKLPPLKETEKKK